MALPSRHSTAGAWARARASISPLKSSPTTCPPVPTSDAACRAQRTGAGFPDLARERRERLQGDVVRCREVTRCAAVHCECSDGNRLGTALLQRGECATNRRTGVDDIVDDRDTLAPKLRFEEFWDRIRDWEQAGCTVVPYRRRVGEGQAQ